MQHLFDMRPDRPGYRLQRLEVFNWGTFDSSDGRIHRFEPQGRTSLLVGHNGTGKSTLVDAILTLLVDSRSRNYNFAAGAKRTERTPASYIKGAFDRTSDEMQSNVVRYLRPKGNHLTAISAVFRDEQLAKCFTLTQILHLNSEGTDDKIYAISDVEHELELDLAGLVKSDEVRNHLKKRGYQTTKTYTEYHGWIAQRTKMRAKAVDMFNQTVHVKDIQSLNTFIRKHMLEAHDWQDKIQRLLTHFNDLSLAHQELVNARRAFELLQPVEEAGTKYRTLEEKLESLVRQQDAATSYFPFVAVTLLEPWLADKRTSDQVLSALMTRMDSSIDEARDSVVKLKIAIDQAAAPRLKTIPDLIKVEETHLKYKELASRQFLQNIAACGIGWSGDKKTSFASVREQLLQTVKSTQEELGILKGTYEEHVGAKAATEKLLREERIEFQLLQQRRTNLPSRHTAMRSQICADLHLDEAALPFAAELISVLPEHRRWEASAEMVLRSFALSLLVPERFYRRVCSYVESNRIEDGHGTGQRLDYICVGVPTGANGDRSDAKSLLLKLQLRPKHEFSPWVRGEILKRFDFRCCESVDEFNGFERNAMTENRHIKFNSERHQKDDRLSTVDPRFFVLGWDNTEKKRCIADHIRCLEAALKMEVSAVSRLEAEISKSEKLLRSANDGLAITDFDSIDVFRHQTRISELEAEKLELESKNQTVKLLQARLKRAEDEVSQLSKERDEHIETRSKLRFTIDHGELMLTTAQEALTQARTSGLFESHEKLFHSIAASLTEPALSAENVIDRSRKWDEAIKLSIGELKGPLDELADKLRSKMNAYLRAFREQAPDLDADVRSLDSFLGRLEQLRREDLPRYVQKFKERLNDQVSQEIAIFNTELREEKRQIEAKISQLNEALANVEYNRGTLMRLQPRLVQDVEIDEFRRALGGCLDESLEHTDEANEARFLRIKSLVERLSDKERATWRNKVVDVRNWYDFTAQEIERESRIARSCYDGGSGQSGGEKAKLAFTILVAALAYQYDVDPTGDSPGRFHFVVVDEMFSKVDDQNARYALRLFKQFGLQLLIVSPLTANARVTEPYVDRYLHTVKNSDTNKSQLYSMTAQEYEQVVTQFSQNGKKEKPRVTAK